MGVINYTTQKINALLDKVDKSPEKIENGKTPVFVAGTTRTLDPGMPATANVVSDGVDGSGNPKYRIDFGVPRGLDGGGSGGGGVADSVQWKDVLNKPSWVNSQTKPNYTDSEVGAMPSTTAIPSKTSELTNDSKFVKEESLRTINGQSLYGAGDIKSLEEAPQDGQTYGRCNGQWTAMSGGGSSGGGGGGGNLTITNAETLSAGRGYLFKASADKSTVGTMEPVPLASQTSDGFLSKEDYVRLKDGTPGVVYNFASSLESLTNDSTKEEIIAELKKANLGEFTEEYWTEDINVAYVISVLANDYIGDQPGSEKMKFYIGNKECLATGAITEPNSGNKRELTFSLSYLTFDGKLKTTTIAVVYNGEATTPQYTFSCRVSVSGDDEYYLSSKLVSIDGTESADDLLKKIGGAEEVKRIADAIYEGKGGKKIYIRPSGMYGKIPVSPTTFIVGSYVSFAVPMTNKGTKLVYIKLTSNPSAKVLYTYGYELRSEVFTLSESSTSDEISKAVGGEAGLRKIIKAAEDGNRFYINATNESIPRVDMMVGSYNVGENGDMAIMFSGQMIYLWNGKGGILAITYTKSSNTFSAALY